MSCREYRAGLMEFARGGALESALAAHLEGCPECADLLERQLALTGAMRSLAASAPAPPDCEAGLQAEFGRRRGRRLLRWVPMAAAAMAASLLAGIFLARREPSPAPLTPPPAHAAALAPPAIPPPAEPKPVRQRKVVRRTRPKAPPAPEARPFVPIPYTEPLEPYERTSVMRVDIPVAAFIAAGFRVMTPDPGASIKADLLVGEDGRARAIRPVNYTSYR